MGVEIEFGFGSNIESRKKRKGMGRTGVEGGDAKNKIKYPKNLKISYNNFERAFCIFLKTTNEDYEVETNKGSGPPKHGSPRARV